MLRVMYKDRNFYSLFFELDEEEDEDLDLEPLLEYAYGLI